MRKQSAAGLVTSSSGPLVVLRGPEGLVLRGRVDAAALPDLRAALAAAVDAGTGELVVDLADVVLVDALGLGVLLEAHRRCRRTARRLVLTGVGTELARLLLVTRLARVLEVRPVTASEPLPAPAPAAAADAATLRLTPTPRTAPV